MKHLFVPYEIALLAKEKGFDGLSNYFYCQEGNLLPRVLESGDEPVVFEPDDFLENFNTMVKYKVNGKYQHVTTAPLYQQLVDWFREEHMLQIEIQTPDGSKGKWSATLHRVNGYGSVLQVNDKETYYDAFTEIIEKTLKLI